MNIIKPTPSQAAVALKKFFASQGVSIKLSMAQEAIAVTNGYPNWNVLAADVPTREVKTIPASGSEQLGEDGLQLWALSGRVYGADDDSLYLCWAQDADEATLFAKMWLYDVTDPSELPAEDDEPIYINCSEHVGTIEGGKFCLKSSLKPEELKHGRPATQLPVEFSRDALAEVADSGPTLQEIIDMNNKLQMQGMLDDDLRMDRIYLAIQTAAVNSGLLDDWTYQAGRGERWMEGDRPMIQVSFDRSMGRKFATELVFTLRDNKMAAYVRTWQFHDEEEPARNYAIFMEADGDFDTDAVLPALTAPLSVLIKNALIEAHEHKVRLRQELDLN